jgi:hypothetical protein
MPNDRLKIRRAREEQCEILKYKKSPLLAIFFNGRKNKLLFHK